MKMISFIKVSFYIFSIVLLAISCSKDKKEGIHTTVYGKVTDNFGEPIDSVKIEVKESKFTRNGIYGDLKFLRVLGSTISDKNGNYELGFKTSGDGNRYMVYIVGTENDEDPLYDSRKTEGRDISKLGDRYLHNFTEVIRLYPRDISFEMRNVSSLPFLVYFPNIGLSKDTIKDSSPKTIRTRIALKDYTDVILERTSSGSAKQIAMYRLPVLNFRIYTHENIIIEDSDFK